MRKQKIYIGRRRKNRRRTIPWFRKKITMTFTETTSSPVRDFLARWASLINEEYPVAEASDNPPFSDKVFHIDFPSANTANQGATSDNPHSV